ncbi:MAG TPA: RHS repeat-associated core domain-containing protein [Candidatus Angelobacter sp.]|nr:RHS repeat-associated core domain-containing protein [Candidatus Angelobacter sp.]
MTRKSAIQWISTKRLLYACLCFITLSIYCAAQENPNLDNGIDPYGSYHGGQIDSVSVINGGLTLHAQVTSYPQRGSLNVDYYLIVNSKNWQVSWIPPKTQQQTGFYEWTTDNILEPSGAVLENSLALQLQRPRTLIQLPDGQGVETSSPTLITPDGSSHRAVQVSSTSSSTTYETVDTSGYSLTIYAGDSAFLGTHDTALIIDRKGNRYNLVFGTGEPSYQEFGQGFQDSGSSGKATYTDVFVTTNVTDVDGNTVQLAQNVFGPDGNIEQFQPGLTDTLGRSLFSFTSGSPATCEFYNIPTFGGSPKTIKACYTAQSLQTAFNQPNIEEGTDPGSLPTEASTPNLMTSLTLQDQSSSWQFTYDPYGELSSVTLPTGGQISYTWQTIPLCNYSGNLTKVSRAVHTRTISGPGVPSATWTYLFGAQQSDGTMHNVVTDPAGNDTEHVVTPLGGQTSCSFYETQAIYYQGPKSSGNVLKTVNTAYSFVLAPPLGYPDDSETAINVYPQTVTTTLPGGNTSQTVTTEASGIATSINGFLVQLGDVTDAKEYDYGQNGPGALIRQTATSYTWQPSSGNPNYAAYLAANILDAAATVQVQDAAGDRCSETDYGYDEGQYITATTFGVSNQHGAAPNSVRGNATTTTHWLAPLAPKTNSCLLQSGSSWSTFSTHTYWYDTGEVNKNVDALGNTAIFSYDPAYWGAYRTSTTNALGQVSSGTYDFSTGLITSVTDINGAFQASGNTPGDSAHTSSYGYDVMGRITSANFPDGGNTTIKYTDTVGALSVKETKLQSAPSTVVTTIISYDGLGRKTQTALLDPEGTDITAVNYDVLGRISQHFNPSRNLTSSTPSTQIQYDGLGRPVKVIDADSSYNTTAYNGNVTTTADEIGNPRQSITDALGRVVEVDEPNVASPGTAATATVSISGFLQTAQGGSPVTPRTSTAISIANYLTNNNDDVYVIGSNNHIYEFYDSTGVWQSRDLTTLTGAPAAASNSNLANTYNSASGNTRVYYVGSDQHLHEVWCCNNGNWTTDDISSISWNSSTSNILTNSPLSAYVNNGAYYIDVIGTNQNIYHMYDETGTWQARNLTWSGAPNAGTGSSVASTFNVAKWTTSVYFVATDQHLHVFTCCPNNGNWGTYDVTSQAGSASILTTSPLSTYIGNNSEWIYAFGTNANEYQMYDSSGSWKAQNMTAAGAPNAASGSSIVSSFNPSTWDTSTYYVGTDLHIHRIECCFNNDNWGTTDITTSSGAPNTLATSTLSLANYTMNNSDSLFAIASNNDIYSYGDTSPTSSWSKIDVSSYTGAPSAISGSQLASSFNPNTWKTNVYYVGSDQHLHLLMCCEGGNWTALDLSSAAAGVTDSGTVSLTVGGFTATACYGNTSNSTCNGQTHAYDSADTAWALAGVLNGNSSSPATATVTGSTTLNLTWKTAGDTNAAVSALSTLHDNASLFPNPSFNSQATTFGGGRNTSIDATAYVTQYQYDPLGNLICVEQHGNSPSGSHGDGTAGTGCSADPSNDATSTWRVRRYYHDSLSRLLQATNPESGTTTYSYDNDGNLVSKTDGRGITINYGPFDPLNRVLQKTYSDQEPSVTFTYDTGPNGKGHLTSVRDAAGSSVWAYDQMGRLGSQQRITNSISGTVQYTYYLDGEPKTLTYPSGHMLTFTPSYAGRVLSIKDVADGINYFTGATYTADGQPSSYVNGNASTFAGISNSFGYNSRLQLTSITAASPTQTLFDLAYDFHAGFGDNGTVWQIINNKDATRTQSFTYDSLNRLTSAQNAGTDCSQLLSNGQSKYWASTYSYDPWGNLLAKNPTKCESETLSQKVTVANQVSGNGTGYDAMGNMTALNGSSLSYNAEGQTSTANGYSYLYDNSGHRVAKLGTSNTLYWFAGSEVIAETDASGTPLHEYVFYGGNRIARLDASGQTYAPPYYYFSNHLHSTAIVADAGGNIQNESDYYPWGGELPLTSNMSNSYLFSGKEFDLESGNHNFGARYHNWNIGRFMSPDPVAGLKLNPQSMNGYSYVWNSPTILSDPSGAVVCWEQGKKKKHCTNESGEPTALEKAYEGRIQQLLNSKDPKERARGEELAKTYDRLKNSDITFHVGQVGGSEGSGELDYRGEPGQLYIQLKDDSLTGSPRIGNMPNNQKLGHEFKHGEQFLDGLLGFQKVNGKWIEYRDDLVDEANAFIAGFMAEGVTPDQAPIIKRLGAAAENGTDAVVQVLKNDPDYRGFPAQEEAITPMRNGSMPPDIYAIPRSQK